MGRPWEVFEVENPWMWFLWFFCGFSESWSPGKLWWMDVLDGFFLGWILDEIGLISRRHEIVR